METAIPSTTPEPTTPPPAETPPISTPPKPNKKLLFILLGIFIILLAIGGIFAFSKLFLKLKPSPQVTQTSPTPLPTPTPDPTANWKTYSSDRLKYSFRYPKEWTFYPYEEDNPEFAFGSHSLSSYSGSEIEKYMDHGIVDWKKFLGDKPAIKIDFFVYSEEIHQIDSRNYPNEIILKSAIKMPKSNLQIGSLETIQYKTTEDLGPTEAKEINQYYAFPNENRIIFISLYAINIPDFEYLQKTSEWQTLTQILSTFRFD